MAQWVHLPLDHKEWHSATEFSPPLPSGSRFPVLFVEFNGFVFEFWSLEEMDVCIHVLSRKNLPDVTKEWVDRSGPGKHWLNKLPGRVLSRRYREPAVRYLRKCREEYAPIVTAREDRISLPPRPAKNPGL